MRINKLIIAATVLILIAIFILVIDFYVSSKEKIAGEFAERHLMVAQIISERVKSNLKVRSDGIRVLATFPSLVNGSVREIAADLSTYYKRLEGSHVTAISFCNEQGAVLYSTDENVIGASYLNSEFFGWAKSLENTGEVFFSTAVLPTDLATDRAVYNIQIVTPVYSDTPVPHSTRQSTKFVGAIVLEIDTKSLLSEFLNFFKPYAEHAQAWIIDVKSGNLLFGKQHPDMTPKNIHKQDESCFDCHVSFDYTERVLREPDGVLEYKLRDGPTHLAGFTRMEIGNASWVIVACGSYEEAVEFVSRTLRNAIFLIVLVGGVVIAGSMLVYRNNRLMIQAREEAKHWREKRNLEEKVLRSEERYRTMVETAHDIVWTLDTQGNFTFINSRGEEITGHKISALIGKSFAPLIYPEDLPKVQEVFLQTLQGKPQHYEVRVYDSGGKIMILSVNTVPLYEGDIVIGTVSFGRDVTERKLTELASKRAEEALRKKDEHHRTVVENIFKFVPEGLLVFTRNLNLMKQNKAFEEIVQKYAERLGYTEEELGEKIIEQLRTKILAGDTTEIRVPKKDQ